MNPVLYALLGVVTSFVGSFLCFIIWLHFHLDRHWQDRNDRREQERWAKSENGRAEIAKHHAAAVREFNDDAALRDGDYE